jgi:alpha-1,3-rhamnosyl/mannosyltransferase
MRIVIDVTSLLLPSAGVKSHIYYWVLSLQEAARASRDRIGIYPPGGIPPALNHKDSYSRSPVAQCRFRLVQLCNLGWNPALDFLLAGADVFHCSQHTTKLPRGRTATAMVFDLSCWTTPEYHTTANNAATRRYGEKILTACDGLIAISRHTREDANRILGIPLERMRVIPPGVPECFFDPGAAEAARIRSKYGLEGPYILFVGCIEPRKNVPRLIRAYRQLPEALRREVRLVIAGPFGWEGEETRAMLESDAGVRYLGYVPEDDMAGLYGGATLFVYPSFYEGFGLPVAQAMAAGVPVIASDRAALPEVVGEGGLLINPESAEELSAAMERILNSPELATELGKRARLLAERFHWTESASKSLDFFHEVAGQQRT